MFRMPNNQPAMEEATMVNAGKTAWYAADWRNGQFHPIVEVDEYPPERGNHWTTIASRYKITRANQK